MLIVNDEFNLIAEQTAQCNRNSSNRFDCFTRGNRNGELGVPGIGCQKIYNYYLVAIKIHVK